MEDGGRNRLTDRYVFVLVQLNRLMYGGRLGELKKLNLNVLQMHTVIMLNYHGAQRMGAIADYLGCPFSRATTIANHLVSKNYVQRDSDPNDRRVVVCELTDQGREAAERFLGLVKQRALKVVNQWDLDQHESVVKTLELLWSSEEKVHGSIRPVRLPE